MKRAAPWSFAGTAGRGVPVPARRANPKGPRTEGSEDAFKTMATSILADLAKMIIRMQITAPLAWPKPFLEFRKVD